MPKLKANPVAPVPNDSKPRLDYAYLCVHHKCPTLLFRGEASLCLLDWLLMVTGGQRVKDVLPASKGQPPALVFSGGLLLPLYRPSRRPMPPARVPLARAYAITGLLEQLNGRRLAGCFYSEADGEAVLYFSALHDIQTALAADDLIGRLGWKQWQHEDDIIEVAVHPESVRQFGR